MHNEAVETDEYFGGCPSCGKTDGYLNIGKEHWAFCREHKAKWCIGYNLFSTWQDETGDEQRRKIMAIGFDAFQEVKPVLPKAEPYGKIKIELDAISSELAHSAIEHIRSNYLSYAGKKRTDKEVAAELREKASALQGVLKSIEQNAIEAGFGWALSEVEEQDQF